jgi:ornithine--oxo-acid transaminase
VLRIAPPLIIDQPTLDWGIDQIAETLRDIGRQPRLIA